MLALMGARFDKNIDFETIRETAKKANSYTKAYSKRSNMKTIRRNDTGAPISVDIPQCGTVGVNSTVK
jgi:hypothetical protein